MKSTKPEQSHLEGTVTEALPNALFRLLIDGEKEEVIAYLSGKMRKYYIRVLVGDRVLLKPDEYGGKPRIIKRL